MGSFFSTLLYLGGFGLFAGISFSGLILRWTQPGISSFKNYIKEISELGLIGSNIMLNLANIEDKDFYFYRVVSINLPNTRKEYFLGVYNGWHRVEPSNDMQCLLIGITSPRIKKE